MGNPQADKEIKINGKVWDNMRATSEGWQRTISSQTGLLEIERIDDLDVTQGHDGESPPVFKSDYAALQFVCEQAQAGSRYHARALGVSDKDSDRYWAAKRKRSGLNQ
jgi:hypothetical protein